MQRGQLALIVPANVTVRGSTNLANDLRRNRVKVLGANELVLTAWNDKSRDVVQRNKNVQQIFTGKISGATLRQLRGDALRIAKLWNWSIDTAERPVSTANVKRLWSSLKLDVREDVVIDRTTRKSLGKVRSAESKARRHNWSLWQSRGWTIVPGWFGWWEKLYCWSETFVSSGYGGTRQYVDFLSAEVAGPNHYAYNSRYSATNAYAEHWTYIWVGMTRGGRAYSYARLGSASLQITSPYLWPRI